MPKKNQKKAPSFPFYVRDWLVDLGEHPLEIEGAWIRFCAKAWLSEKKGVLTKNLAQWARLFGVDLAAAFRILQYLQQEGIGDVFPHVTEALQKNNAEITVMSRRMIRDEKEKENNRLRQKRYRATRNVSQKSNAPVTAMKTLSSSSSASAKKKEEDSSPLRMSPSQNLRNAPKKAPKEQAAPGGAELSQGDSSAGVYLTKKGRKLTGKKLEAFERFWEVFAYKKGKADAADAWLGIQGYSEALVVDILASAEREAQVRPSLTAKGHTPKMAQGWLSSRRWEDEDLIPKAGRVLIGTSGLQTILNAGPTRPSRNPIIRTETDDNSQNDESYTVGGKNYVQLKSGGKKGVL